MLEKLELVGFKSFNNKTILEFPAGITVIVGPNGSGKSNIIDALRWLLGERETKNLRGLKAEDLIFSGTKKKTRLGMAQATLYFNNSLQILPVDFADVAIARRIHRDGASDYLINKSSVRLKDLIDLFAKSKMGAKGFSIINQGDSDLFVKVSSRERREMIEEMLGLRQYQLKKHDALLKLNNTQINLEQSKITANELLPRLRLLRRQTDRLEKRAVFVQELKDLEDRYFSIKVTHLQQQASDIDPKIYQLDKEMKDKLRELNQLESEVAKIEKQKPKPSYSSEDRFKLQKELSDIEAQLKFAAPETKAKASSFKLSQTLGQIRDEAAVILNKDNNLDGLRQFLQKIIGVVNDILKSETKPSGNNKNNLIDRAQLLNKQLLEAEKREREARSGIESFNDSFRGAYQAVLAKKDNISGLKDKRNQLLLEKDRWRLKWQDLDSKIKQAGRDIKEFSLISAGDFDFDGAESKMAKLRAELVLAGDIDEGISKEAQETEQRYQFLSSQISDLEKAVADLNELINNLDEKIKNGFSKSLLSVNSEFDKYFKMMFGEGRARLAASEDGVEIELNLPSKGIKNLDSLSGGEKSLVAIAALFALISASPPPFLVFDEIDAALDERNSSRFAELLKKVSPKTQFVVVTHNRAVMECADVLYGVTMGEDGISKVISLKLD